MGFFKNLVNKMTGGGAKVFAEAVNPALCEPFEIKVTANVSDADLKIDKVYLYIKAVERVVVRDFDIEMDGRRKVEDVFGESETYRNEIIVSGPQTLQANQSYEWTVQVELPNNVLPTYLGNNAWHEWEIYAGLDAAGNDPDSGWVKIELY
jgi:hypothetical protein